MATPAHSTIINAIPSAFEKAKASGDLLFFPSDVHTHRDCGVNFNIALCPALLHKPPLPTPHFEADRPPPEKRDVFSPPYNSNLLVGELKDDGEGTEYVVLLNKYSVVPNHFLLVTKSFQSQMAPLLPPDLVQAYSLLLAARKAGQNYFAFYNCGDQSGASQPHKHVQFIPTQEDGPPIEELASAANIKKEDKPFALPSLPYAHHIRRLAFSRKPTWDELEAVLATAYIELLDLCISTVRQAPDTPVGTPSYNVVLTLEHLILVPRVRECHTLQLTREKLPVNALGFAGMLLVKSEPELRAVIEEGPAKILRGVGCESVHESQVQGGAEAAEDEMGKLASQKTRTRLRLVMAHLTKWRGS